MEKECTLPKEEFLKEYELNANGLSEKLAKELLQKDGLNEISQSKPKNGTTTFLEAYLVHLIAF